MMQKSSKIIKLDIPSNYLWYTLMVFYFWFFFLLGQPEKKSTDSEFGAHRFAPWHAPGGNFLSFKRMFFGSFLLMLWRIFPELNFNVCKKSGLSSEYQMFFVERSECNGERRVAPLCVTWAKDQNLKVQQPKSHTRSLANSCKGMGCTNLDTVKV